MGKQRGSGIAGTRAVSPAAVRRWRASVGPAALLLALTFAAYLPATAANFIWDDDVYITANPHLRDLAGLQRIWLRPGATMQYYPVAFSVLWLEHRLWGDDPAGYHVANIALHGVCAVLLWLVLARLGVPGARLAAAVFAVHPVLVESVAWCAELKNVLSAALYLSAMLAWFAAFPAAGPPTRGDTARRALYTASLVLFGAALLVKPAAVGLPLVILLIVWWRRGAVSAADALRVAPMVAMGVAMSVVTALAEREYSGAAWQASLLERCLVAGRAIVFYAAKLVWPVALTSVYPRWQVSTATWWQYFFPAAVAATLAALWLLRRRIGRGPLTAALSYCLLLAPALGFVDVAYFRYSFVADHFQYHAAPALIALGAAGVAALATRLGEARRAAVTVAGGALVVALGVVTWRHCAVFADEQARCADAIARNPDAWVAMESMGVVAVNEGRPEEAVRLYHRAIEIAPDVAEIHLNLGVALDALGRRAAASDEYREALHLDPDEPRAHEYLGRNLARTGRTDEAAAHLAAAVRLRPYYAPARVALGMALLASGRAAEATEQFRQALALDPAGADARAGLERAAAAQRASGPPPGG